ncbi:alpha/beta hydrolase (plasmid) [Paraburkholderia sp. PREW-6R]|uniref:alpha/beta hydrolase n=1 Tax=Paraburkholderia sp. PREW-6R TaxID=3141544 RepID=UPI0031F4DE26
MRNSLGLTPECQVIPLWGSLKGSLPFGTGRLELFAPTTPRAARNPAVIVVPGGGYKVVAPQECTPVALVLREHGFHVGILYYRTTPHAFPHAFNDLTRAVRLLRNNADGFGIDGARIGLIGFSAGGHLAGLVSFAPNLHTDLDDDLVDAVSARPNRLMLVYALVRLSPPTHEESVRNFLGASQADLRTRRQFDLERLLDSQSPPFHLTHAIDDDVIPISGALALADRARDLGVPFDWNIMHHGGHGFTLRAGLTSTDWPKSLLDFLGAL